MKELLFVFSNLIGLIVFGQAPNFPTKSGFIYYSFEQEHTNTKNCLAHYFTGEYHVNFSLQDKLKALEREMNESRPFFRSSGEYDLSARLKNDAHNKDCIQTVAVTINLKWPSVQATNFNPVEYYRIQIKGELRITEKSKYSLVFKSFELTEKINKRYGEDEERIVPLSDFLKEYNEADKKDGTKEKVMQDIDYVVNKFNLILNESFEKSYTVDEL